MKQLLQGDALVNRAKELGIDVQGDFITVSTSGRHKLAHESVLQERVIRAEDAIRQNRLWILALVSAVASVLSAAVALIALVHH